MRNNQETKIKNPLWNLNGNKNKTFSPDSATPIKINATTIVFPSKILIIAFAGVLDKDGKIQNLFKRENQKST